MTSTGAAIVCALGAAAASGAPHRLREALAEAAPVLPADDIEELLLQTYLFAGFPRAINAFMTWQAWAGGRKARGEPRLESPQPDLWRERGERLCRLIYGGNYEALQMRLARLHPALAEWTLIEGYGKVLSRPGPGPDVREMAAVGALIAMGERRQLASHLRGALHTGVEPGALQGAVRAVASQWGRVELVDDLLAELEDD